MTLVKTNPLQALISAAAKVTPNGDELARHRSRTSIAERLDAPRLVLADVSSSMAERAGVTSKIGLLKLALTGQSFTTLVAFASRPVVVESPELLPPPCGGTALHLALGLSATFAPGRTLVISDGQPDDKEAALLAAVSVSGVIDTLYVGPDDDLEAVRFMRDLARIGSGRAIVNDLRRTHGAQLRQHVGALLLPPVRP